MLANSRVPILGQQVGLWEITSWGQAGSLDSSSSSGRSKMGSGGTVFCAPGSDCRTLHWRALCGSLVSCAPSAVLTSLRDWPGRCTRTHSWRFQMLSHMSSPFSFTASPGAGLGVDPDADEGLASCPAVPGRPVQEPAPVFLPATPHS